MWYFTIQQNRLKNDQYQKLQKVASLTEVEVFNEPYENYCLFEVKSNQYQKMMDLLDLEGIYYEVSTSKPTRDDLLARMR